MRRFGALLLLSAAIVSQASGQVAQFRHVAFITSTTYSISSSCEPDPLNPTCFGGHLSADYQINELASAGGLYPEWNGFNPVWKAVISTTDISAKNYIEIRGSVYNTHGDLLAVDAADFWDSTLLAAVNYDQSGNLLPINTTFWTGSNQFGDASQTAMDWSTISGQVNVGRSQATVNWLNQAQLTAGAARSLLGIGPPVLVNAGDLDGNDFVDGRDFLLWQRGYGAAGPALTLADGDANGDLVVDTADLAIWQAAYGTDYAAPALQGVPEPSAGLLAMCALAASATRRRRCCIPQGWQIVGRNER